MASSEITIPPRRPEDLPALSAALIEQQPETRYPFRSPLPIPVEDFLHAHDAVRAWTAELDGRPAGHVCRTGPAHGFPDAELLNEVCASDYRCEVDELTWINSLFVAARARGNGAGRRLLATAVEDARTGGARPCLEVLPVHPAAIGLYLADGWQVVHRFRPHWLHAPAGEGAPDVHVMIHAGSAA